MTRWALLPVLLAACSPRGYRDPEDSAALERDISDRNIETRVRLALAKDPQTAPYDAIQVRCEKGIVTLEGAVGRTEARERAVHIAREAEGVVDVVDRLSPTSSG